jgi:hypothetical protein
LIDERRTKNYKSWNNGRIKNGRLEESKKRKNPGMMNVD